VRITSPARAVNAGTDAGEINERDAKASLSQGAIDPAANTSHRPNFSVDEVLAGRFLILRFIGRGGMGVTTRRKTWNCTSGWR
jgi:hypothetical protein